MPAAPDAPATILAFDYGRRRIGVAVGQSITQSASPLGVVSNADDGFDRAAIDRLVREWRPDALIVGEPKMPDGTDSEVTIEARRFAKALGDWSLPVHLVDERYSSLEAERQLREARSAGHRGRIRKEHIDAAAATAIAERYLAGPA